MAVTQSQFMTWVKEAKALGLDIIPYLLALIEDSATSGGAAEGIKTEDTPFADGDKGMFVLSVRNDNLATTFTSLDLDFSPIAVDQYGAIYNNDLIAQTFLAAMESDIDNININISALVKSEDTVHNSGDLGVQMLAVRNDTAATSLSSTDGDYTPVSVNEFGRVFTEPNGNAAHAVADSKNPIKTGGRARTSEIVKVANDQRTDTIYDKVGKQIILPYAVPEDFVSGATADIVDTTATTIIAAAGGSSFNYITQILVTNSHATVGTFVNIIEETSGTIMYTGFAAANGGGFSCSFPTPLKMPTANKALQAKCVTTGANVRACASGYKGV